MRHFILGTIEVFRREELRARRHFAIAYVFAVVPVMMTVTLYADLFDSATQVPGFPNSTVHDFVLGSAMILPGMMAAGFTATGLAEDLRNGVSDRLELLGVSFSAATLGRLLFDGVRILPAALGAYSVALVLGSDVAFKVPELLAMLALAMGWSMAYNAAFQLVARRTGSPQAVQAVFPMFAPIAFLSTSFFPASLMPSWAETVATWNPLSIVIKATRSMSSASSDPAAVVAAMGTIAAIFAIFFVLTIKSPAAEAR